MVKTDTLQKLNPAVAWIILHGSNAELRDLLRLTFFDLVHRKVLKITEDEYAPRAANDPPTMAFVQLGPAAENYQGLPHEEVFMKFFLEHRDAKMALKTAIKLARKNALNSLMFQRRIYLHGPTASLFKRNFWHHLTGGFGLTDAGLRVQAQLQREMDEVKEAFRRNSVGDAAAAQKLLVGIGAMALMVPGINLAQYHLSEEAFKQMRENDALTTAADTGTSTGCSSGCSTGCSGEMGWGSWNHEFDSGCSGHGNDSDSGCGADGGSDGGSDGGGDSGCSSGCSGCGGGCGGD